MEACLFPKREATLTFCFAGKLASVVLRVRAEGKSRCGRKLDLRLEIRRGSEKLIRFFPVFLIRRASLHSECGSSVLPPEGDESPRMTPGSCMLPAARTRLGLHAAPRAATQHEEL